MIKRISINGVVILTLTILFYYTHQYLLNEKEVALSFSLFNIYLFNLVAYLTICILVEIVALRLPTQVGYLYLATVFIKLGIFVLVFKDAIFNVKDMILQQKLSLVLPVLIYLTLEAIYCGRQMNLR